MVISNSDDTKLIRCPVCLTSVEVSKDAKETTRLRCTKCARIFEVCSGLPSMVMDQSTRDAPIESRSDLLPGWAKITLAVMIGGTILTARYGDGLKGPEYLWLFGMLFVALITLTTVLRHTSGDMWLFSVLGFLLYEGTGAYRIITGIAQGMHKFLFLALMMLFGGLCFFLRAKMDGDGYGFGGHCGLTNTGCGHIGGCGGGGGGCGGGGGGGGGCGGCGGS
jgi:uncharacterized protein YbaR (Trm112 family)